MDTDKNIKFCTCLLYKMQNSKYILSININII